MLNHVPEIEIPSFTPSDRVINPDFGALRRGPGINRIVLIGNGFDLAHGLKTSYTDFIEWYWTQRAFAFRNLHSNISRDSLCQLMIKRYDGNEHTWSEMAWLWSYIPTEEVALKVINEIFSDNSRFEVQMSSFFANIHAQIKNYKWVDIECEYYKLLKSYLLEQDDAKRDKLIAGLNDEIAYLKEKLIEYLKSQQIPEGDLDKELRRKIYAPIKKEEVAVNKLDAYYDHIENWTNAKKEQWCEKYAMHKLKNYDFENVVALANECKNLSHDDLDEKLSSAPDRSERICLPNRILFLNFNYTNLADAYCKNTKDIICTHIHGDISNKEHVIFGYGDEIDETYQKLVDFNNNDYLENIKSIQYNDDDNYRKVLEFIESSPYQIYLMGHSCGISDRTLLNTLFEHKNCVSIKPFYHEFEDGADNYRDLVKNISRNFTDMKLMRSLVVNKKYCETI